MRFITQKEKKKRGCEYCTDFKWKKYYVCKHDECPYHELDGHKTYNEYLKSCPEINLMDLLQTKKKGTERKRKSKL